MPNIHKATDLKTVTKNIPHLKSVKVYYEAHTLDKMTYQLSLKKEWDFRQSF